MIKNIRRITRKQYGAEEKIRIVLDGSCGEEPIAVLCRREGTAESLYYNWSKEFLEDDVIMASGVAFRGLSMPSFMDNVLRQVASIRERGLRVGPINADKIAPTTAKSDMGMVAARLLADDGRTG